MQDSLGVRRARSRPPHGGKMLPASAANRPDPPHYVKAISAAVVTLIETNLAYAHAIATEVTRKLPPEIDRRDIQRWAELGLVEAANSFDRTRGVQFKTFAHYRIKGAIYDGLRKMGWYPKAQYQRLRFEMAANEYLRDLSEQAPRPASAEDKARELHDLTATLVGCYMLSLEALGEEPVDQKQLSAEESVVRAQQGQRLRHLLAQLPEKNRRVLQYCYFDELTFEEIGRKLGLSKSWVCRLHAKSLEMLRQQLTEVGTRGTKVAPATFAFGVR